MTTRTLDEQFAGLPDHVKAMLFVVLDRAIDTTQEEKDRASRILYGVARDKSQEHPIPALFGALASLLDAVGIAAQPQTKEN